MIPVHDQVLDELAWARGSQDTGIVLLFKDHGLVAQHHPVPLGLLVHVRVVALPLDTQMQLPVAHLMHLYLLVGPVQLQPVHGGAGFSGGHLVLEPVVDELYVHRVAEQAGGLGLAALQRGFEALEVGLDGLVRNVEGATDKTKEDV